MKIEIHSLFWPNTDVGVIDTHRMMMAYHQIPVNYTAQQIDHGQWMTNVIEKSKSDIVVFLDIDCVPISADAFWKYIKHLRLTETFFGVAQVSNHIPPAMHIYAAPAFFGIHKKCWDKIKVPMVAGSDGRRAGDVCELFTYAAEDQGIEFDLLFPTAYFKAPREGVWRLADRGCYGIGTIFDNSIYHLYQSRFAENIDLYKTHCCNIIDGTLDVKSFIEVKDERLQK